MIECSAYDSNRCQSCQLIKTPYLDGLESKIELVRESFETQELLDSIQSDYILEYRNKAKFVVGGDLSSPILGIPGPQDNFKVSPLLDCPLHTKLTNKIANSILSNIRKFKLVPYDIVNKTGEFKYLILSEGHGTAEISIRFGMRSLEALERVKKLYVSLKEQYPQIKVCCFEVQPKHAAIFTGVEHFLSDTRYIQHDFGEIQLSSSSSNFFQVNSLVAKKLYEVVLLRMEEEQINISVDLFCGVGGFAQQLSKFSHKVYGIEINQVAIDCANYSKNQNNLKNIEFICDDANDFKKYISAEIDLVVVNPPRRGLGDDLCNILSTMGAKFLIYSSCNPKTLKKDLERITSHYELESITPVDMFPLTKHLEVLCILKRKD
jgi:23S rRNA (uracil747-C5)-methyltransferase